MTQLETSFPLWPSLFIDGLTLYMDGHFFEAHEVWETLWLTTPDATSDKLFYQACIQLAVSRHHQQKGNKTGANNLWAKAVTKFEALSDLPRFDFFKDEWLTR